MDAVKNFFQRRTEQKRKVRSETHLKTRSSVNQRGTGVTGIRVTRGIRAKKRYPVKRLRRFRTEAFELMFMGVF